MLIVRTNRTPAAPAHCRPANRLAKITTSTVQAATARTGTTSIPYGPNSRTNGADSSG